MSKENQTKLPQKPELKSYTIKMEVLAPVTLIYSVMAENPEQALQKINPSNLREVGRPILSGLRRIQAKVYRAGTIMLELAKKF